MGGMIAACTSRAAPSMSRLMSNCSVIRVEPTELDDVISVTEAIAPRCRSSGVARWRPWFPGWRRPSWP